jgi:hypothetical protein
MNPYLRDSELEVSRLVLSLVAAAEGGGDLKGIQANFVFRYGRVPEVMAFRETGAIPAAVAVFDPPHFAAIAFGRMTLPIFKIWVKGLGPQALVDNAFGLNPAVLLGLRMGGFGPILQRMALSQLRLFGGYSHGGAVALSLASLATDRNPSSQSGVVTFGSPRPFSGLGPDVSYLTNLIRWFRGGDQITSLPPRVYLSPVAFLTLSVLCGAALADWYQPPGGRAIFIDNEWQPQGVSLIVGPIGEGNLLGWATGTGGSLLHQHGFPGYVGALGRIINPDPPFWSKTVQIGGGESPSGLPILTEMAARLSAAGVPTSPTMGCFNGPSVSRTRNGSQGRPVV